MGKPEASCFGGGRKGTGQTKNTVAALINNMPSLSYGLNEATSVVTLSMASYGLVPCTFQDE